MGDKIKKFTMDNKKIITIILSFIVCLSFIHILVKSHKNQSENKNNKTINVKNNSSEDEFTNDNTNKEEVKKETKEENKDLGISVPIENGFKTTICDGANDEEIIEKNCLDPDSNLPIKDRLEAKRVAENFVQAISIFDSKNPENASKIASKYVCEKKKKEIIELYNFLGNNKYQIKNEINDLCSDERHNEDENDYIYISVFVSWDNIDENNQKIKGSDERYMCKLLKENNQYKVFEYYVE